MSEPIKEAAAAYTARLLRLIVGVGYMLALVFWLVPYCLAVFGGVLAEAAGRRLLRVSDWIYERAHVEDARRWKESILGR